MGPEGAEAPHRENPLHDFYEAPLLDISSASGLAAGFYANFARPILDGGFIVDDTRSSRSTRNGDGSA